MMSKKKKHSKKAKIIESFQEKEKVLEPLPAPHHHPLEQEKESKQSHKPALIGEESKSKEPFFERLKKMPVHAWLILAAVCVILLYPRIISLTGSQSATEAIPGIYFEDPDSVYHARRILYIAQNHMQLPFFDPMLAHPKGAVPIWSPLHDWIFALPSFILGLQSDNIVLQIAALLTVILGMGQLLFYGFLIFKATKNIYLAMLASFLIGIAAPQISFTRITNIDHNVTVLFIFSLLVYKLYCVLSRKDSLRFVQDTLAMGLLMALLFWAWPGSFIYIVPGILIQIIYVLITKKTWLFVPFAQMHLISALIVFPLAMLHYGFSKDILRFEYVSFLTVLFLGASGIMFYALAQIFRLVAHQSSGLVVIKLCISLAILAVVAIILLKPLMAGVIFATAQQKWVSTILECHPLFYIIDSKLKVFTLRKIIEGLGYLAFLFPVAFFFIAGRWIKIQEELYCIVTIMGVVFTVLAVWQTKFLTEVAIPFGLMLSLFTGACFSKFTNKKSSSTKSIAVIMIIALLLILLNPLRGIFRLPGFSINRASYSAFKWLKEYARAKGMPINSYQATLSSDSTINGVMAPWEFGHSLKLYSQIPTVADNFGYIFMDISQWQGFYDMARFFLTGDENEAIALLQKFKCKYVFVSDSFIYERYIKIIDENLEEYFEYWTRNVNGEMHPMNRPKIKFINSIGFRMSELFGSALPYGPETPTNSNFLALKHFRLIYELPPVPREGNKPVPSGRIKIYEYVKGAPLQVPGSGDLYYTLQAEIRSNSQKNFLYRQRGYLKDGIIVPYPNVSSRNYSTAISYRVEVNGAVYKFNNISESDIE